MPITDTDRLDTMDRGTLAETGSLRSGSFDSHVA
jgi:hypothetical protein